MQDRPCWFGTQIIARQVAKKWPICKFMFTSVSKARLYSYFYATYLYLINSKSTRFRRIYSPFLADTSRIKNSPTVFKVHQISDCNSYSRKFAGGRYTTTPAETDIIDAMIEGWSEKKHLLGFD